MHVVVAGMRPEPSQRRLGAVRIASGDQDAHTEAGERRGDVEADAGGASGDERGLAGMRRGRHRARTVATRPTTSSATMAAWSVRSKTVRGPTPTAIVNSPTAVPRSANPCAHNPIVRLDAGAAKVAASPAASTPAMTPSAIRARLCSSPLSRIPA